MLRKKQCRIEYSVRFREDLFAITSYVWRHFNDFDAATKFAEDVIIKIEKRAYSPGGYSKTRVGNRDIYKITFRRKYVIYYVMDNEIMRVLHISYYGNGL
jgi:plasmid stabilization system protein ParE